jgi:hypothetical protein
MWLPLSSYSILNPSLFLPSPLSTFCFEFTSITNWVLNFHFQQQIFKEHTRNCNKLPFYKESTNFLLCSFTSNQIWLDLPMGDGQPTNYTNLKKTNHAMVMG